MNERQLGRGAVFAVVGAALLVSFVSASVRAGELSSKEDIEAAVGNKTYQGSMLKDAFAEYYSPDGSIKGDGYSGKWRASDGLMCFQYGDKPENCWNVTLEGPAMTMYKDGQVDGNGILVDGNPHNY